MTNRCYISPVDLLDSVCKATIKDLIDCSGLPVALFTISLPQKCKFVKNKTIF